MEQLRIKRKGIKAQITRLANFIFDKIDDNTKIEQIQERSERLLILFNDFLETQLNIDMLTNESEMETEENYREAIEDAYFSTKSEAARLIKQISTRNAETTPSGSQQSTENNSILTNGPDLENALRSMVEQQRVLTEVVRDTITPVINGTVTRNNGSSQYTRLRLEPASIPKFNGNYREWKGFFDTFKFLVHNNTEIPNSQKYVELKKALIGEAASIFKNLDISDANYLQAFEELILLYDRDDFIIEAHLQTILDYPKIRSPDAENLRKLNSAMSESVRGLKALSLPTDQWHHWLVFITCNKLDNESLMLWRRERSKMKKEDQITFEKLTSFIQQRIYELSVIQSHTGSTLNTKVNRAHEVRSNHRQSFTTTVNHCLCCKKADHFLHICPIFLKYSIECRRKFIYDSKLCFNCMKDNHMVTKCKSHSSCRICNKRHHTLLHQQTSSTSNSNQQSSKEASSDHLKSLSATNNQNWTSILPTAVILVENNMGELVSCRALLDSGSQVTLVSEKFMQFLKLKRTKAKLPISGIGMNDNSNLSQNTTRGKTQLTIKSRLNNFEIQATAYILPNLTSNIPSQHITFNLNDQLANVELADPEYYLSRRIDILIGCDIFFNILKNGKLEFGPEAPIMQQTTFGWVVSGKMESNNDINVNSIMVNHSCIDIDDRLRKFWEIESVESQLELSKEEQMAEDHYAKNTIRLQNGRYQVRLPFKIDPKLLGNSKKSAYYTLLSVNKKLKSNEPLQQEYCKFMQEYEELGHLSEVSSDKYNKNEGFYLPHHAVIKEASTTTKLRVVFNGSKQSTSGLSLNNILMIGPTIQPDLVSILFNFRVGKIAYTADIAKMYRQILVHQDDRKYQQILWKKFDNAKIIQLELNTVTYGTACAPFSAIRTLVQLASDEKEKHPIGSEKLSTKFYVDDFIDTSHSIESALQVKEDITAILEKGGFTLRKWASNSEQFLTTLSHDQKELQVPLSISTDKSIKTLGIYWYPSNDSFMFKVNMDISETATKRSILSDISRIFDPLGWISPCIILAKILIQELWINGLTWDEKLPDEMNKKWLKIKTGLKAIEQLQISRWLNITKSSELQIYGFADASVTAYAAVVYLKVINDQNVNVHLVSSKTRVAPTQSLSIARLELCAAHLLTKLIQKVKNEMHLQNVETFAFTDSTIVLAWLKEIPKKWNVFVSHRTSDILSSLPFKHWRHISSKHNPADCASRGLFGNEIKDFKLWWNGPQFIHKIYDNIPEIMNRNHTTNEEHRKVLIVNTPEINHELIDRYSSLNQLKRITAWCCRFINNIRNKQSKIVTSYLSSNELKSAFTILIRTSQQRDFKTEIDSLLQKRIIPKNSKLSSLNPFIDEQNVLRVGGRIQLSNFNYDKIHPIILSNNNKLTNLLIHDFHCRYFHAGQQIMISLIYSRFWVIRGKPTIKSYIRKCTTCIRQRGDVCQQQMGNLPSQRLQAVKPFTNTGVDYAGPFEIKSWKGRGAKIIKCYISLFTCMSTRAVHIELVSDLTTNAFLAALHRFMSRRGICLNMYSDNGRNFLGASRKLTEIQKFLQQHNDDIIKELNKHQITWHFIPAHTPHFGGSWESAVKLVKTHLKIITISSLTYEELSTILCQIEGIVNSRPLAPKSNDIEDLEALTPGHFLTQGNIILPPQEKITEIPKTYRNRWQYVHSIHQWFWKRWSNEYITLLQNRNKWKTQHKNLKVNDLVLIKEDNLPPCKWLMGRIIATKPGKDGLVRVVSIKCKSGVIDRAIHKLCILLPSETNDASYNV